MHQVRTLPNRVGNAAAALLVACTLNACQRASYFLPVPTVPTASLRLAPAEVAQTRLFARALPSAHSLPRPARVNYMQRAYLRVRQRATENRSQPVAATAATKVEQVSPSLTKTIPATAHATEPPLRQRSRTVAIILAALSVAYIPLGLHNFYLGYYGRGALTIGLFVVGSYLLLLGAFGLLTASGSLAAVGVIGLAMLAGGYCWQVVDLIRIITGSLQPKDGSYRKSNHHP